MLPAIVSTGHDEITDYLGLEFWRIGIELIVAIYVSPPTVFLVNYR